MREYTTPLRVELPTTGNLTDSVVERVAAEPSAVGFLRRDETGWQEIDWATFHRDVTAAAKGLIAAGVGPGDRVALLSRTRYEWTVLDYAIWWAGAVTVPIYDTSSVAQIEWILADSAAGVAIVETPVNLAAVESVRDRLPDLGEVWCLADDALAALAAVGAEVDDDRLEERRSRVTPDSPATLIYTSGTTGAPKGCLLTHGNFMVELTTAIADLEEVFTEEDASTLLFLPLAHVFARIIQVGCIQAGVRLGHSADIATLMDDLAGFRPTFLLAVPRVFEMVYNTASQRAVADGRGGLFGRASAVAIASSRAQDPGGRGGLALRAQHRLFDALVYRRLRAALGGRCRWAISGGAPLGERLGHFYRGIGLVVLEGYGLTETTGAVTVNVPTATRIGTVGRPLQGTGVRVAPDGELLVKGGQVFTGYWNDPAATAAVLDDDGWLCTGDLGEIDEEGFVRVTGRKKEIIVTAGGKNVAPAVLEDRVRAHYLVDQCLVVGDGRPFIAALITLDHEAVAAWADRLGKPTDPRLLVDDPDLVAEIEAAVADANAAVSRAEAIRRTLVLPDVWSEEAGLLTPSLKLRRSVAITRHLDQIEAIYAR